MLHLMHFQKLGFKLTKMASNKIKISCCVDNRENIINIQNAAYNNNSIINIYIEYDCGAKRCGLDSFSEIQDLIDLKRLFLVIMLGDYMQLINLENQFQDFHLIFKTKYGGLLLLLI